jgi:hypothetical protein
MTSSPAATLADELAAAEHAAAEPGQRAATLQAALKSAIDESRFDDAHRLQAELVAAREASVLAEARVAALRDGAVRLDRERAAAAQELVAAQQRDLATRDLAVARGDESRGAEQVKAALAAMYEAISTAQKHLRAAESFEPAITNARQRVITARGQLGEWPPGHPGPAINISRQVESLKTADPFIRGLSAWHG